MNRRKTRPIFIDLTIPRGYAEWISAAKDFPPEDQNWVWEVHEDYASQNQAADAPYIELGVITLGGEA